MFICDCHCDTLTELYKKCTSLYDNDQHFDIKRQIELGGGLQFCAIFDPDPRIPLLRRTALYAFPPRQI